MKKQVLGAEEEHEGAQVLGEDQVGVEEVLGEVQLGVEEVLGEVQLGVEEVLEVEGAQVEVEVPLGEVAMVETLSGLT